MRTNNVKKYFCLLAVLLFIVPSVAALNMSNNENKIADSNKLNNFDLEKPNTENLDLAGEYDPNFIPAEKMSVEVLEILKKYSLDDLEDDTISYLKSINENMLERRARFAREYSYMPYIPLDITQLVAKYDEETGLSHSVFPGVDLDAGPKKHIEIDDVYANTPNIMNHMKYTEHLELFSTDNNQPESNTRSSRAPAETDLEVLMVEWEATNDGLGSYFELDVMDTTPVPGDQYYEGGFQVGKANTIKVTIRNNSRSKERPLF